MKRWSTLVLSAALLAAIGPAGFAWAQRGSDDHRRSMGNLRIESRTAGGAIQGSGPPRSGLRHGVPDRGYYHGGHGHRDGRCYSDYGFGYDPYWSYGYPSVYPEYVYPYWPPVYPAPLYLPAETIYGPQALRRFLGFPPASATPAMNIIVVPDRDDDEAGPDVLPRTNAESVATGRKFIAYGDAQFAEQQYGQAHLRYKKAAQAAPQLAQAYLRQGWALVASGRYELAMAAFKKGLELDPDWPASDFRLDELYGPNRMAKTAHVDALAAAAAEEPDNPDLLFLVGVFLFFDGQPHRARPFFERITRLPPGEGVPIGGFLAAVGEGEL